MDVEKPLEQKISVGGGDDSDAAHADMTKGNNIIDNAGDSEKLNLDRRGWPETKQTEPLTAREVEDKCENNEMPSGKAEAPENKSHPLVACDKSKLPINGILAPPKWSRLVPCYHMSVLCPWRGRNVNSQVAGIRTQVAELAAVNPLPTELEPSMLQLKKQQQQEKQCIISNGHLTEAAFSQLNWKLLSHNSGSNCFATTTAFGQSTSSDRTCGSASTSSPSP
ncbi:Uncharacterized protein Rs2_12628 [Raphanus sativus]|nr:Uncharacterized protein Rs2_12628 [Raphanus sativus]